MQGEHLVDILSLWPPVDLLQGEDVGLIWDAWAETILLGLWKEGGSVKLDISVGKDSDFVYL